MRWLALNPYNKHLNIAIFISLTEGLLDAFTFISVPPTTTSYNEPTTTPATATALTPSRVYFKN